MTTPQLTLYNTLTRTKEAFKPIDANNVRMYVCGPTVYDFAHIGNARPVIVFDVLYRLLKHLYPGDGSASDGSRVTYVRNITDVDDKINARALRDFPDLPLNEAIRKVTEKTEAQFLSDAERLGNLPPTHQPRATDNIAQMVTMIQQLLDSGNAYVARGTEGREALFDVTSMTDYGALSRRNADAKLAGSRIEVKDHKRNPEDFVLWKESSPSEPGWDARFVVSEENGTALGLNDTAVTIRGRPGWHIECSAMSDRYLWDELQGQLSPEAHKHPHTFDIHGGGLDLIFPHHENEIAQSRCAHGTHAMANIWMHNGFLQVEGQKMSKSLGNFYTISQLLDGEEFGGRRWPGEVLRLAMLMTHYREPIDFSVRRLEEAEAMIRRWAKIRDFYENRNRPELDSVISNPQPAEVLVSKLADDLNTVTGIQALLTMARVTESAIRSRDEGNFYVGLRLLASIAWLGIDLGPEVAALDVPKIEGAIIDSHVAARLAALNAKDFTKADTIRNELSEQGIALMDYKDESGQRQTKWEIKR